HMERNRQDIGNLLVAESMRVNGTANTEEAAKFARDTPWTDDFNDHQMSIIVATMAAMGPESGWNGRTPQDVLFSAIETWGETMHPGEKMGQYMGSVLHNLAKVLYVIGSADQPKRENLPKIMSEETAKSYIKGKVDAQFAKARAIAEELAFTVITTPADREVTYEVTNSDGEKETKNLGVPGLGLKIPTADEITAVKSNLEAKEAELERKSGALAGKKKTLQKMRGGETDDSNQPTVEREIATLEGEIRALTNSLDTLRPQHASMMMAQSEAKGRAALVASNLASALINSSDPISKQLEGNPELFSAARNQNKVLMSALAGIDGLVAEREALDSYKPKHDEPKITGKKIEAVEGEKPKTILEFDGGEKGKESELFKLKKAGLALNITKLMASIRAAEIPQTVLDEEDGEQSIGSLKGELMKLAESVGDLEQSTDELKAAVETNRKQLRNKINPMRAVVEAASEEMDDQMLIMNATYDGGLDRQKGSAPQVAQMTGLERMFRGLWKLWDFGHGPKIIAKTKKVIYAPFKWLDGGMANHIPVKYVQNADGTVQAEPSRFPKLRQFGYKLLWPFGSPLLRRWKNWDNENNRTKWQWRLLRGASMAVLGPTWLWTLPQGYMTDRFGYIQPKRDVEKLTGWEKIKRKGFEHGFGLRRGILGAAILTPFIGVGVVGLTNSVLLGTHSLLTGGDVYREERIRRRDEGTRLAGLEGEMSDFWYAESPLHDAYRETFYGFPSGYFTLPLPGGWSFGWPAGWVSNPVSFSNGAPRPTPENGDFVSYDPAQLHMLPQEEFDAHMRATFPGIDAESLRYLQRYPQRNVFAHHARAGGDLVLQQPAESESAPPSRGRGGSRSGAGARRQEGGQNAAQADAGPGTEAQDDCDGGACEPEGDGGPAGNTPDGGE
ncbi:MAG: hypothetical protein ABIH29_04110, partial [Candidatus Micrarchaeota archaeon]